MASSTSALSQPRSLLCNVDLAMDAEIPLGPLLCWKDRNKPYGEPNELFDGLQIVLSHLVLDPYSPFALAVPTSRGDYEIAKVYLWDQPFETIYRRAPEREPATHHSPIPSP